jgi:hypothetical protein
MSLTLTINAIRLISEAALLGRNTVEGMTYKLEGRIVNIKYGTCQIFFKVFFRGPGAYIDKAGEGV